MAIEARIERRFISECEANLRKGINVRRLDVLTGTYALR